MVPTTPAPAALGPELSQLESDLEKRGFDPAVTHYRQAVDNFVGRYWEAANGQIRSFAEDLFIGVGGLLTGENRSDPIAALQDLRNAQYLDAPEF